MRRVRSVRLVPFVLAVLVGAPRLAAAQAPASPPDPVNDAAIHLGPFGLNPALNIRDIGEDANVFNDATNPKSDFTATVTPRLEVLVRPGPILLTYTTSTDYVYYRTYTSERGTNFASTLRADFDLGAVRPFLTAARANSRDRLNREIDVRARHHDESYGGGVRIQLFQDVFATAGARQSKTAFETDAPLFRGQNLATTMNQTTDVYDVGGGVALTPLTTLQVVATKERSRFAFLPERNSDTLRVTPIVTFSPLAILNGSAAFGYRRFSTHSPLVPDFQGFVSTVTLATTILERHRLDATFNRDLQYSYEEQAAEYLETAFTLGWVWQVVGPIELRASGGRSRLQYRSPTLTAANDEDVFHTYGVSLGCRLREHLRAGINGEWRGRTSQRAADRAYDNRRIYATLAWGK